MKRLMSERGSVLIEAALVMPVFFFVLIAGLAFMFTAIQKSELTRAVTIGAEYLGAPHTDTDPCQTAATRIQQASPALNASLLTVSVAEGGGSGSSCPGLKSGSGIAVTINASYPTAVPFFAAGTINDSSTVIQ